MYRCERNFENEKEGKKYIKIIIWYDLPGRNAKAFANVVLSATTNKKKTKSHFENHFVLVETYAGTVWVTIFINEIYCETTGDIKQNKTMDTKMDHLACGEL